MGSGANVLVRDSIPAPAKDYTSAVSAENLLTQACGPWQKRKSAGFSTALPAVRTGFPARIPL